MGLTGRTPFSGPMVKFCFSGLVDQEVIRAMKTERAMGSHPNSTLLDRPVRERPVAVCVPLPSFVVHDAPESLLPHPLPFVLSQSTRRSDRLYPGLTTLGHQS
jgi:hypothetical protein